MSDVSSATPTYPTVIPAGAKTVTTHDGWALSYSVDAVSPFTICAWNVTNPYPTNEPFWHQPHDLTGAAFADQATAQAFADKWIQDNFLTAPPAPPAAPTAPAAAPATPASN
jgi:hypothetical protein